MPNSIDLNSLAPSDFQVEDPNDSHSGSGGPAGSIDLSNIDSSQVTPDANSLAALNALGPVSGSNTSLSTPQYSATGFSPADIIKQPIMTGIVQPATRIAEAATQAVSPLLPKNIQDNIQRNLQQPQTTNVPGLGNFTVPPMTSLEQAGGEFAEALSNPAALATGGMAGAGARILTMGGAGALAGGGQAASLNQSPGQVALATGVGGATGLALGGATEAVSALVAKGISQSLADAAVNRYQVVFKPTEEDIQSGSQYRAMLTMQQKDPQLFETLKDEHPEKFNDDGTLKAPETLAAKSLKTLSSGSTQSLLDQVNYNMETLKGQLNKEATQSGVSFQLSKSDVANYTELLQSIQDQFGNKAGDPAFSSTATEAKNLMTSLQRNGGTMGPSDVLELRQFLDDMRKTSDFRTNATLSPKGEQFQGAADKLRIMFNKEVPGAKKTMGDFVDAFDQRDALLQKAVKEGKATPFSLSDMVFAAPAIASGNPGVALEGPVARRLTQNTNFNTTVGKMLQGGSDFTSAVNDKISSVLGPRALSAVTGPIRVAGRTLVPTTSGAAAKLVAPPNQ